VTVTVTVKHLPHIKFTLQLTLRELALTPFLQFLSTS